MTEKTLKLDEQTVKAGRLIRTWNKGHDAEDQNDNYHYAVWVEDANGKNERCLILTPDMLKIAEDLAKANPEDIPKKGIIQDILD